MALEIFKDKDLHIFDLGNVLYSVDARRTFAALEALGMPHQDVKVSNSHAAGGVFSLYCDGKVSTPEFYEGVRRECLIPEASDDEIRSAWDSMLIGFRPDALAAVRHLRQKGRKVALLSNCNDLHAQACRAQYPGPGRFDDLFDGVFFSHEIGMSKPDPRTWQLVLSQMGVEASRACFYDDSDVNVGAAIALGIDSQVV